MRAKAVRAIKRFHQTEEGQVIDATTGQRMTKRTLRQKFNELSHKEKGKLRKRMEDVVK